MNIEGIITSDPVNGTAAIVTNQKGCVHSMSAEDRRDSLLRALNAANIELRDWPKGHPVRDQIGQRIYSLHSEISEMKKKIRKRNIQRSKERKTQKSRELAHYILDECRSRVGEQEWKEIVCIAKHSKERDSKQAEVGGDNED